MQGDLYQYCKKDPLEFWKFTPAETQMMILRAIEDRNQEYEYQNMLEARLCAVIYNANGATRKDKKPFEASDFLPKEKNKNLTPEMLEKMAISQTLKMGGKVTYG